MPWGAAIAAGGAIIGGVIASNGAKDAANAQAGAARDANDTQLQMYNQTRADNMPALGARNDALARLESLLGVGGNRASIDPTQDPGYQFGLNEGMRSLNNQLAAHGMRDSGAALKAAARYGNDYATTKYDAAFNRIVNPLQSLAGLGQSGANSIAASGMNSANNISANQVGLGNALGASQAAQGAIWGNTTNQLAGIGAGWYQNRTAQPDNWRTGVQDNSWYSQNGYGAEG